MSTAENLRMDPERVAFRYAARVNADKGTPGQMGEDLYTVHYLLRYLRVKGTARDTLDGLLSRVVPLLDMKLVDLIVKYIRTSDDGRAWQKELERVRKTRGSAYPVLHLPGLDLPFTDRLSKSEFVSRLQLVRSATRRSVLEAQCFTPLHDGEVCRTVPLSGWVGLSTRDCIFPYVPRPGKAELGKNRSLTRYLYTRFVNPVTCILDGHPIIRWRSSSSSSSSASSSSGVPTSTSSRARSARKTKPPGKAPVESVGIAHATSTPTPKPAEMKNKESEKAIVKSPSQEEVQAEAPDVAVDAGSTGGSLRTHDDTPRTAGEQDTGPGKDDGAE